jgi:hypothetical protein
LLLACSLGSGAHRDVRPYLLKLKVVRLWASLQEVDHVLWVAGVSYTLHTYALVRVVARLGDVEGLVDVTALGFLLGLLAERREPRPYTCRKGVIMDLSVEQLEAVEVLADRAVPMDRIAERTGFPLETVEFILYGPESED